MAIGVPYDVFWHLNPVKLEAFYESHKLHRQQEDYSMYLMGIYVQKAVGVAVEHCLNGRKAKSEYFKKPILSELDEAEYTDRLAEFDAMQMERWAKQLERSGVPETVIN